MSERGQITCHVLDTSLGFPGNNIEVLLEHFVPSVLGEAERWTTVNRACPLLVPSDYKIPLYHYDNDDKAKAIYRITFYTAPYFNKLNQKSFYPYITETEQHYHIPLLISPFSYTTYRGS
ncbi:9036_t:CDS:2 [Diversispora eburnea]|uniref:9036_t:CDS:1 n=1 Tax=Diversispora eburnea TaxID=1213867 RepID=A0A9N9C4A5_9GLOM|nr:9036_t:CDS:2 [Diversispora eburnea]